MLIRRRFWRSTSVALLLAWAGSASASGPERPDEFALSQDIIERVARHGPWPPPKVRDGSNRVSGESAAISWGEELFFDERLSRTQTVSCGSCHDPQRGWTDGKDRAGGLARLDRNTQSIFNVAHNRWFGWDGRSDSLWAHSIGPILSDAEMGMNAADVAALIRGDDALASRYETVFGHPPHHRLDEMVMVDVAKALAAFQETIVSGRTAFDRFRDALARGDHVAAASYPAAARRGAALFFGRANCHLCHVGPRFTNDEFDDAGVPYFTGPGTVDRGRHTGIETVRDSPYNQLSAYNDAPQIADGWATRQVAQNHRTFGQFKVPSLRELTRTAPYMHDGSLETLTDVVRHYSQIDLDRIHSDGGQVLQPLHLSDDEIADMVAFLKSLSTPETAR